MSLEEEEEERGGEGEVMEYRKEEGVWREWEGH